MTRHRSFRSGSRTQTSRTVLNRRERVALLKKRGQWEKGDRVTGLPKTKPEL